MNTIPVIVESGSELESGTLGVGDVSSRIAQIDADALRQSINNLTGQIAGLFKDIEEPWDGANPGTHEL